MNDKNKIPEELLDSIIMRELNEEETLASVDTENRERFLSDLYFHRSAAVLIQQQNIIDQVKSVELAFLQKQLQGNRKIGASYNSTSKKIIRIFVAVAAIFLVTATAIVLYWYNANASDKLFGEQYQTYQVNVERSGTPAISPIIREYHQKHFREVIASHEKAAVSTTRDKMVVAGSYMEVNRFDAAITVLSDIISENIASGNKLYHDEAEYYLALAYMKTKDYPRAYQLFDKIYTDKEHTFNGDVDWWFLTRVKWLK